MIKKLGKAFSDELFAEKANSRPIYKSKNEEEAVIRPGVNRSRVLPVVILVAFVFSVLLIRIYNLMVVNGVKNREIADNNRIRLNRIIAPRGIIYDRNMVPLVRNSPVFQKRLGDGTYHAITQEEALDLESGKKGNLNSDLKITTGREYLYKGTLAHVLGYMTEITDDEIKNATFDSSYHLGDKVGRLGIEEEYEKTLRGTDGQELVEVNAAGNVIKKMGVDESAAGRDVIISIDSRLSELISASFPENEKGAVVASNPKTGEILGLYSSPSFDPNFFTMGQSRAYFASTSAELARLLTDRESPLFNRVTGGIYPSGSTFKIITSAAGLESGKINAASEIEDTGVIVIGPYSFPNWYFLQYGGKEGFVNVIKAIKRSNDIFFYKVGEMVGLDGLVSMAKRFGLSQKTGIDLPFESKGLMPDEEWKQKTIGDNWYLGDTYHLAIGQGYLLVTPLQVNTMTGVIASGGKLCKPYLLKSISNNQLKINNEQCRDIGLKTETVDLIKEGMRQACSPGGTAWPFFDFSIKDNTGINKKVEVGCKTGTAEFGDPKDRTHAWFTVFAPLDDPQISLTVLVEGAGEGSNVAAPIAKKVLEGWLGDKISQ